MRAGGPRECLATLPGDHGVGDAGVGRAATPVGQPLALETVEEAGDAGGRQPQALGEIDPAQLAALRVGEVEQRLKSFALRPWSASRRASIDRISEPCACRSRTKTVCAETCGVNT